MSSGESAGGDWHVDGELLGKCDVFIWLGLHYRSYLVCM